MTSRPLAHTPVGRVDVPELVRAVASGGELEAIWVNGLGGLTFRDGARYLKWNPLGSGIDLESSRAVRRACRPRRSGDR